MKSLQHISVVYIFCDADAGAHIRDCLCSALELAAQTGNSVQVKHNDKHYVVDLKKILNDIYDQHP